MKKTIISFLSTICIMASLVNVQAVQAADRIDVPVNENASVQKTTEYEMMKSIKAKSDKELKDLGLTDNKIKEVRDFDFAKEVTNRAKLDDITLKAMGYTSEGIAQLKNFKGTEREMIALSSIKTTKTSIKSDLPSISAASSYLYFGSSSSYFTNYGHDRQIYTSWSWSTMPYCLETDLIGIGWQASSSSATYLFSTISSGSCFVKYAYVSNPNDIRTTYPSIVNLGGGKASISIPMTTDVHSSYAFYWAREGGVTLNIHCTAVMSNIEFRAGYGHSVFFIAPSLTVGGSGVEFSFSPSYSISEQGFDYDNFN